MSTAGIKLSVAARLVGIPVSTLRRYVLEKRVSAMRNPENGRIWFLPGQLNALMKRYESKAMGV